MFIQRSSEARSVSEATGRELGVTSVPSWASRAGLSTAEPLLAGRAVLPAGRPCFCLHLTILPSHTLVCPETCWTEANL